MFGDTHLSECFSWLSWLLWSVEAWGHFDQCTPGFLEEESGVNNKSSCHEFLTLEPFSINDRASICIFYSNRAVIPTRGNVQIA